jgi:leucyl aminopeptidase (aminopeptidase T)
MQEEEKIKMFNDVFAPKSGENVLFLIDIPHDDIKDNQKWIDRREMAKEWFEIFSKMGDKTGFSVKFMEYKATGLNNKPVTEEIKNIVKNSNLVLAMTEFSATSSILPICRAEGSSTRGASMPRIERRMENSAFKANYQDVKRYAQAIEKLLNKSVGAEILFSTNDTLYIDLRNRKAHADTGDCTKYGQGINFPSGEAYKAPYEAAANEIDTYGPSKTQGIWPVKYDGELVKYSVENNKIVEVIGEGKKADERRSFFNENETRKNIAELGIGCNPKAVVTGNVLEDEKVSGLHIAYGLSSHLGGTVKSDVHQDICYPKGAPVEAKTLTLIHEDGSKVELIKNAELRYDLLK